MKTSSVLWFYAHCALCWEKVAIFSGHNLLLHETAAQKTVIFADTQSLLAQEGEDGFTYPMVAVFEGRRNWCC